MQYNLASDTIRDVNFLFAHSIGIYNIVIFLFNSIPLIFFLPVK